MVKMRFANALRHLFKKTGWTGLAISKELGHTSRGAMGNILNCKSIGSDNLIKFCDIMGYNVVLIPKDEIVDDGIVLVTSDGIEG